MLGKLRAWLATFATCLQLRCRHAHLHQYSPVQLLEAVRQLEQDVYNRLNASRECRVRHRMFGRPRYLESQFNHLAAAQACNAELQAWLPLVSDSATRRLAESSNQFEQAMNDRLAADMLEEFARLQRQVLGFQQQIERELTAR